MRERVFRRVVGMTEKFAVDDELDDCRGDEDHETESETGDEIDFQGEEEEHRDKEKNIRHHIILRGVFSVFRGLISREREFCRAGTVESVG